MRHRLNYSMSRKPIHGFTLVELLVVISIIALLLSILMPSLQRARTQAKQIVCSNNLKQSGTAYNLYSFDYNSQLPKFAYLSWYAGTRSLQPWRWGAEPLFAFLNEEGIYSYISEKKMFYCPSDQDYKSYSVDFESETRPRWSYMAWLNLKSTELRSTDELQCDRPLTWHNGINVLYGDFHVAAKRD